MRHVEAAPSEPALIDPQRQALVLTVDGSPSVVL